MKNRGMMLESIINRTNQWYRKNNIALIHKKELNIKFSSIDKDNEKLKLNNAFIKQKSQSDYYGIHQGGFITFEAKSTELNALPISNIKEHQHSYLREIIDFGGIAFYIVLFKKQNRFFYVDWITIENLNKKSFSLKDAELTSMEITLTYPGVIDYLKFANKKRW